MDAVERREISGKIFSLFSKHSIVTIQIVPGMHLATFLRFVEKDNVCFLERNYTDKAVKKENFFSDRNTIN